MLSRHLRTHLILAPSTNVGKSIVATGLCRASVQVGEKTCYLKPVGTGTGDGDDETHVKRFAPHVQTSCLFRFDEPVSPHLAVERAQSHPSSTHTSQAHFPSDKELTASIKSFFDQTAEKSQGQRSALYIESAGGVHSPTLSGSSQIDVFRSLRPPVILVAAHELGGLSTTISAYESLVLRGYEVDGVVIFREEYYRNYEYLSKWFAEQGIKVHVIKPPPPRAILSKEEDGQNMMDYYEHISLGYFTTVVEQLHSLHERRLAQLDSAAERTLDKVWWPFVQHGMVKKEDIMVIDSAQGDFFSVYHPETSLKGNAELDQPLGRQSSVLHPVFDGSASWWTQCLGHANPILNLASAAAAGRYGHVLFPNATSEPALSLCERLLDSVGQKWASRVFFSDDGSTGMEVALKMGLRAYSRHHGLASHESAKLAVLGLTGSYHGDTIGAMDACEGNVYNKRVEWYQGRGLWLDPPLVKFEDGQVVIRSWATDHTEASETNMKSMDDVYDVDQRMKDDALAEKYRIQIESIIRERYQ